MMALSRSGEISTISPVPLLVPPVPLLVPPVETEDSSASGCWLDTMWLLLAVASSITGCEIEEGLIELGLVTKEQVEAIPKTNQEHDQERDYRVDLFKSALEKKSASSFLKLNLAMKNNSLARLLGWLKSRLRGPLLNRKISERTLHMDVSEDPDCLEEEYTALEDSNTSLERRFLLKQRDQLEKTRLKLKLQESLLQKHQLQLELLILREQGVYKQLKLQNNQAGGADGQQQGIPPDQSMTESGYGGTGSMPLSSHPSIRDGTANELTYSKLSTSSIQKYPDQDDQEEESGVLGSDFGEGNESGSISAATVPRTNLNPTKKDQPEPQETTHLTVVSDDQSLEESAALEPEVPNIAGAARATVSRSKGEFTTQETEMLHDLLATLNISEPFESAAREGQLPEPSTLVTEDSSTRTLQVVPVNLDETPRDREIQGFERRIAARDRQLRELLIHRDELTCLVEKMKTDYQQSLNELKAYNKTLLEKIQVFEQTRDQQIDELETLARWRDQAMASKHDELMKEIKQHTETSLKRKYEKELQEFRTKADEATTLTHLVSQLNDTKRKDALANQKALERCEQQKQEVFDDFAALATEKEQIYKEKEAALQELDLLKQENRQVLERCEQQKQELVDNVASLTIEKEEAVIEKQAAVQVVDRQQREMDAMAKRLRASNESVIQMSSQLSHLVSEKAALERTRDFYFQGWHQNISRKTRSGPAGRVPGSGSTHTDQETSQDTTMPSLYSSLPQVNPDHFDSSDAYLQADANIGPASFQHITEEISIGQGLRDVSSSQTTPSSRGGAMSQSFHFGQSSSNVQTPASLPFLRENMPRMSGYQSSSTPPRQPATITSMLPQTQTQGSEFLLETRTCPNCEQLLRAESYNQHVTECTGLQAT